MLNTFSPPDCPHAEQQYAPRLDRRSPALHARGIFDPFASEAETGGIDPLLLSPQRKDDLSIWVTTVLNANWADFGGHWTTGARSAYGSDHPFCTVEEEASRRAGSNDTTVQDDVLYLRERMNKLRL